MIYLDNASTTQIDTEVLNAMMPYLTDEYGNPGSIHPLGVRASKAIAYARKQVAELLHCEPEEIIFTSGGTESNNTVIKGAASFMEKGQAFLTSPVEHDSVLSPMKELIKQQFYTQFCEVNRRGIVSVDSVYDIMEKEHKRIGLVSIMGVNNELGGKNDLKKIGDVCRYYKVPFHTDCVQAVGEMDLDVGKIQCDYLSLSSHKVHAPKGNGVLYINRSANNINSLIKGGATQEFGMRGGTENVVSIVGFGKACELLRHNMTSYVAKTKRTSEAFVESLKSNAIDKGIRDLIHFNSDSPQKILNIRIDGCDAETLVIMLGKQGVCVSAGSACHAKGNAGSTVLKAVGMSFDEIKSSLRVSFSRMNTLEEAEEAARILCDTVCTYKKINN